jgi:hypothetical protein
MASWTRCTSWGDHPRTIYINLDQVLTVERLKHAGGDYTIVTLVRGTSFNVVEEPDTVIRRIKAADEPRI